MIESVPNVSEGRNPGVLDRVAATIRESGTQVLDVHSDPDHHRSVFTLVGTPDQVVDGILDMVEVAVASIDITRHRGEHPRIGAVDVVPFVPLDETTIESCVSAARRTAKAIGRRFSIPVYLYEKAASRPDRRNLANIRRGGTAALSERIGSNHGRPDFGPCRLHPTAGATAVGVRPLLVAYNVNLASDDLAAARSIAAAIRASNGGLAGVKALGVRLHSRGIVQVTMNLTDVTATPVSVAFERVCQEAGRRGVRVFESEIVGLAPRAALSGATTESLLLTRPLETIVLENRIPSP